MLKKKAVYELVNNYRRQCLGENDVHERIHVRGFTFVFRERHVNDVRSFRVERERCLCFQRIRTIFRAIPACAFEIAAKVVGFKMKNLF